MRAILFVKRAILLAISLLAIVALSDLETVNAQLRLGNLRNGANTVFAIAPREATRPLKIAEKAIAEGEFQQAIALLGDLLADTALNEYLIPDQDRKRHVISLRRKAEQLLGQIPFERRESYQEKYGVKAKVMLQKAVEANDTQAIALTSRLFFHTRAGLEATMLIGHTHLSQGRPVMAAVAFEKVARQPQGRDRFDPEATLLAAVSWSLNGANDRASQLLKALKARQGDAEVRFYGKTVALFDENTPLQNWLKQIVASTPLESHPIVNQWLVFRGDSQRNAESGAGFPLLSPRWSIRTVADPTDEAGVMGFQQKLIQAKISPMPKVHPLAIGNTLVIRTDDRMFGVDANNGKRIWSYPPANMFRSAEQQSEDSLARPSSKLHQDKLRERLWLDTLYGQISSDGNSIFLIPNPGISTDRDDWRSYQTQVYDEPTDLRLYNELKSLDLKQQGALQWEVGGESGLDEPQLARSFFLGAPLPIGNRLYAICVQDQSVRLVVLDSQTGRLQWARHLASTEESVSFREQRLRRLAGATPSEANGVLICPTGLNAIVAVDLATQSLSWGFQFKEPRGARVHGLTDQLNKWDTMWRDASVTLTGGVVIYTPIDSSEVYCLNLQTGESLWDDGGKKQSRIRYRSMHVETVRDGNIIITSSDRLKAIKLATGAVAWETRLNDYGLISGRGYVSGNHCFVPTTSKKVLRISTLTGEINGIAVTEKVLGNLISFRGDVISHGADHLTAYPRDEPSRLMLAQGDQTQLDDHAQLSIKAQLHLLDGEYEQAVDSISRAYDLFPNSNYARVLVQSLTRLINVDFGKAERVSNRYQNLFEKQDLHRLLRAKVTGLMKLNRLKEAFEVLLEIAETIDLKSSSAKFPFAKSRGQGIHDGNSVVLSAASVDLAESLAKDSTNAELTMQLTQWLRWKLNEVYQASDAETQQNYRDAIAHHLKSFPRASLILRHDRMRFFPITAVDEAVRMETAVELLAAGHFVRANSLMVDTHSPPNAGSHDGASASGATNGVVHRAKSMLRTMVDRGCNGDSISTLKETIDKLQVVQSSGRAILDPDLYHIAPDEPKVGQLLRTDEVEFHWPHDVIGLEQEKLGNYFTSTQHFCEIVATDQPELNTLSFRYSDEFREFQMYDRLGRSVHKIYLDPDGNLQGTKQGIKGRIFLHKSLLLLCIDKEMFAIDWEKFIRGKAALLWYAENVACSSSGLTGGNQHGICVLSDGMLMSLSPFTGEVLWQRSQVSTRSVLLEGNQTITVWSRSQSRTYDQIDPMVGRLLSCGKMDGKFKFASLATKDLQLFRTPKKVDQPLPDLEDDLAGTIFGSQGVENETDVLNLFDFNQQKVLWTRELPYPAKPALIDQDKLLVLSGDGVFSMIDVRSGKLRFETRVSELKNSAVSSIVVGKFKGIYVVTVYSTETRQSDFVIQDDVRVTFQRMHKSNALINGNVVALDATTGESVWKYPIAVQRFQQLEGLPWDSPFLFFARKNIYESGTTSARIQMAMVDLHSGKLKANELFTVPMRDNVFYQAICRPRSDQEAQASIELQVAALKAKFHLGDVATAPQPVAALTNRTTFKRMREVVSTAPVTQALETDFQNLTDRAIAAQNQRKQLSKQEVRLTELEMKKK